MLTNFERKLLKPMLDIHIIEKPERQKIRPRERVYPYDIIVHNGGLEQY